MRSLADFLKPWWQHPIVAVDFETTGPDPHTCLPVEVAAVRFEHGQVVARHATLINPGVPIEAEATAIHGITDEMVASAPAADEAIDAVLLACGYSDAMPCAYNAPFDSTILRRIMGEREACFFRDPTWPWLDPIVLVRIKDRFVSGKGRHKLTAVCARRGIELEDAHRATADAEAAGRLLFHPDFRSMLGDRTIGEALRLQQKHAREQEADFQAWKARQPAQEPAQ